MDLKVTTLAGKAPDSLGLRRIFGLEPRQDLIQRVVLWQLAKKQQGTQDQGPFGDRAHRRQDVQAEGYGPRPSLAASAPQFRGGGKAHGPVIRSHAHDLPKKVRALWPASCAVGQGECRPISSLSTT
jgi:large subunit ribosomal protein L4